MSARVILPDLSSLDALDEGPWSWSAEEDVLTITATRPPASVEPVALAMLSAWATYQRALSKSIVIDDGLKSPLTFRLGLLGALAGRAQPVRAETGLLRPLRLLGEPEMDQHLSDLVERMQIPDEATSDAALHILEDLARNVFHHACTRGGGAHVAATYDAKDRLLRLGVADCGQGIAKDIQTNLSPALSDTEAVEVALEPEISGSAQPGVNRGVGLHVVRRLALAAGGAMWLRTGRTAVAVNSATPAGAEVRAVARPAEWRGVAVAVTLRSDRLMDFRRAMQTILDELEATGPRARPHGLQFFHKDNDDPDWQPIVINPDRNKLCYERTRAREIALHDLAPRLARGERISLDFSSTRTATQAFCHALIVDLLQQHAPQLLGRLRFIGCSSQVRAVLVSAANYGLSEHTIPSTPT